MIVYIPLLAGIVASRKYGLGTKTFFIAYLFATCGIGFYFNNLYRMGNIFPSDICLMLFLLSYIFLTGMRVDRKQFAILVCIVFLQLLIGLLCEFEVKEILTDIKYVLYFFIPYYYMKSERDNKETMQYFFKVYCVLIALSLLLNWINFFKEGLVNIAGGGGILRTFMIGMGFSCGCFASCLLMDYKDRFERKYGRLSYCVIQIILIISCIVGYTRTNWIAYGLTLILNWLFVIPKSSSRKKIIWNIFCTGIGIVALIMGIYAFSKVFPQIYKTVMYRFSSISELVSATANNEYVRNNTLSKRIEDVLAGAYVYTSPQIFIGYGYGALYNGITSRGENSFVYYTWKYGLIAATYLFYCIYHKVLELWKSTSLANRSFSIYLVIELVIGSMSGNYSFANGLGMISFLMGMNYKLIFDEDAVDGVIESLSQSSYQREVEVR